MKRYLYFACTIMLATLIASEGAVTGRAQASNDPELPRVLLDTTMPDTSGWLVKTVKASGGNYPLTVAGMQQAIDDAAANTSASGIIIKIDPTDLVASLVLKRQAVDNRFIFIRSSSPVFDAGGAVPPGKRVSPAYASEMVTLRANTGGSTSVIRTEFVDGSKGASFYRVIGIRATVTNTLSAVLTAPIRLGDVSAAQNQLAEIASDLIIDRCYIHGSPLAHVTRGVYINSARTAVIDSHIEEIHGVGQDTQAIISINTPGPLKIVNNYMEAAGENYLSGGADPAVQGLVTEDIEFRRNYMTKKLRWKSAIIPAPAGVVATAQAGGALEADKTYTYKVVALGPVGATTAVGDPSAAAQATTTATDRQVEISLSRVQYPTDERNATSYRIYVSADGGATWLGYFTHIPADPSAATHTVIHDGAQTLTSGSPAAVGTRWTVKNVFELKYGRRVLVEANILEYSWKPDQDGYGFLIKTANQDGGVNGNWAVTEDVTIRHNKVIHVGIGIAISHKATPDLLDGTKRVRVENNLFYDISTDWTATSTPATASCIAIGGAPPDVQFIHNTIAQANDKGG
ncbi:MAG TPA: hypothetical protein VNO70_25660, partial [Blastocatellia bacterium]|nr:hypothetical protein [Blastocatellia bacterium]